LNKRTFDYFRETLEFALRTGYDVMGCLDYFLAKDRGELGSHTLVLRHDVESGIQRMLRIAEVENQLGIRGTFFVRIHAPQYSVTSFNGFAMVMSVVELGHELGLHEETLDFAAVSGEPPEMVLERDLGMLESLFGRNIKGAASHRDWSGYNNLDFWETHNPSDFGLDYVAYKTLGLFTGATYISQHGIGWKCYDRGRLTEDKSDLMRHLKDGAAKEEVTICALMHPQLWHDGLYHVERGCG